MTCKALLIAAVVAALSLAVGGAQAQTPPSLTVKTIDLDLTSPKDAKRLYDRIYEAASVVCGGGPLVTFGPFPNTQFTACREAVLDSTISQIHAPLVAALRPGTQPPATVAAR